MGGNGRTQPDPNSAPRSQQNLTGSDSSKQACVAMGNRSDFRTSQLADDDLRKVITWKESGSSRPPWEKVSVENKSIKAFWSQWERLSLRDGVLYRRWESEAGDEVRWQLVIPSSLRKDVLHKLHTKETAGHLGIKKTLGRVKERFFWPVSTKDVKGLVSGMRPLCLQRKADPPAPSTLANLQRGFPPGESGTGRLGTTARVRSWQ